MEKFGKIHDQAGVDTGYVSCLTCDTIYCLGNNGTSTLKIHTCKGKQPTLTLKNIQPVAFKRSSSKEMKEKITQSCVEMCARDIRPWE